MQEQPAVYDSKAAAAALGVSERTLQKYAKEGLIRFDTVRKKGTLHQRRLYDAEDIQRVKQDLENGFVVKKKTALAPVLPPAENDERASVPLLSLIERVEKTHQALLQQMEEQTRINAASMETQAKLHAETLQSVVAQIFADQQARREDAFRRAEASRQERQEKWQQRRHATSAKVRGARA